MRRLKFAMDKRVTLEDLRTFYNLQLVSHKNRPVYVRAINIDKHARVTDLLTQKSYVVTDIDEIEPPTRRIGMVNSRGSVVYVERTPVRRMQMGINGNNTTFKSLRNCTYPEGREETVRHVMACNSVEVGEAYMNTYPSFKDCLKHVKEFSGAMAFDKQFAVNEDYEIIYKTDAVGRIPKNCSTIERIEFQPKFKHLSLILGGAYENDLATAKEAISH